MVKELFAIFSTETAYIGQSNIDGKIHHSNNLNTSTLLHQQYRLFILLESIFWISKPQTPFKIAFMYGVFTDVAQTVFL